MRSFHSLALSRPLPSPALHVASSHLSRSTANHSELFETPALPQKPFSTAMTQSFAALDSYEWPYPEVLLADIADQAKYATWRTHDHLWKFTYAWRAGRFNSARGI